MPMHTREVSELLGIHASNVNNDIRKGRLKATKLKNGNNMVSIDDFIEYIKTYPTMYEHFFETEFPTRVSLLRSIIVEKLTRSKNFARDISFSTPVIAEILGVHRSTIAHYIQQGELKGHRCGERLWCCYGHDVLSFVVHEQSRYYDVLKTRPKSEPAKQLHSYILQNIRA